MKITYTARKVNLRDNFKDRAEKKLSKFGRIFSEDATVNVVVTLEKNRQTVEVTIKDKSMVYRAEATDAEMNDALDKVVDVLGRQIRKHKAKLSKKLRANSFEDFIAETALPTDEPVEEEVIINSDIENGMVDVDGGNMVSNLENDVMSVSDPGNNVSAQVVDDVLKVE